VVSFLDRGCMRIPIQAKKLQGNTTGQFCLSPTLQDSGKSSAHTEVLDARGVRWSWTPPLNSETVVGPIYSFWFVFVILNLAFRVCSQCDTKTGGALGHWLINGDLVPAYTTSDTYTPGLLNTFTSGMNQYLAHLCPIRKKNEKGISISRLNYVEMRLC
jgi:hypothetical protein